VTINGSRFLGIEDVTVGGVSVTSRTVTTTKIRGKVGAGALTGPVAVTNDGGTFATTGLFRVTPNVTPWPLAPVQVDDTVHLAGTNLLNDNGAKGTLKLGTLTVPEDDLSTS